MALLACVFKASKNMMMPGQLSNTAPAQAAYPAHV